MNNLNFGDTHLTFLWFILGKGCGCVLRVALDSQYSDVRLLRSLDNRLASQYTSNSFNVYLLYLYYAGD